jgi:hypothetical protein
MHLMHRKNSYKVFVLAFLFLFSACRQKESIQDLPQGTQEVFGIIKSVPLSVFRRGSHILMQNDIERMYIESSVVNLRPFEGQEVTLRGRYEPNTSPSYLPIFLVRNIESDEKSDGDDKEDLQKDLQLSGSGTFYGSGNTVGSNKACGGSAGVLCPDEMVCIVYDLKEGIGHCHGLRQE